MEIFVARQPIFDALQRVYGYELLFRSGLDNYFDQSDPDQATLKVINHAMLVFGFNAITRTSKAFINFTRDLILQKVVSLLPKDQAVVEILENVTVDDALIQACRELKEQGYLLVLDDFIENGFEPLIELADIIKVDFMSTGPAQRLAWVEKYAPRGIKLLAEKVETREEFEQAIEMGFSYFQGYFFSKPVILSRKDIPGFKLNYLQMLQEINRPEVDIEQIDQIIKRDQALCYKLLRYIDSAQFAWRSKISSIKQALILLGDANIKKWVNLVVLTSMAADKPLELVTCSVVRGRFFESLAAVLQKPDRALDFFLMGMFSFIDAITGRPLDETLAEISLAEDIAQALLGGKNALAPLLELGQACEKAQWEKIARLAQQLEISEADVFVSYADAVEWANEIFALQ